MKRYNRSEMLGTIALIVLGALAAVPIAVVLWVLLFGGQS